MVYSENLIQKKSPINTFKPTNFGANDIQSYIFSGSTETLAVGVTVLTLELRNKNIVLNGS